MTPTVYLAIIHRFYRRVSGYFEEIKKALEPLDMKQIELPDSSCNSHIELLRYQVDRRNSLKQHNRNGDASHKTNSPSNQTPFGGIYRRRQAARTPTLMWGGGEQGSAGVGAGRTGASSSGGLERRSDRRRQGTGLEWLGPGGAGPHTA